MLRAAALASVFALTATVALAQPQGDAGGYGVQPPSQGGYPLPSQDGQPGGGYGQDSGGYGQGGYGQRGGGRWAGDPQMHALRKAMRAACASDLSTYCGDASQGGHGAMRQCMAANQTRFTPSCQAAIDQMHAYAAQARGQAGGAQPSGGYGPPQGGYPPPQ